MVEPLPEEVAPAEGAVLPDGIAELPDGAVGAVEPCAAGAVLPGVPVLPMGVSCVLRWPAPTAGSVAGAGGVACAKAKLTVAAAAAAARILRGDIVPDSLIGCDSHDRQ